MFHIKVISYAKLAIGSGKKKQLFFLVLQAFILFPKAGLQCMLFLPSVNISIF